ncbi:uncharacterized protein LOC119684547 [Teleopsis dalmanni]|uniref:uncharacterized protein LOC119684547 n=1 Tax=Teleopsis dalmanni TaxID=139649 RepID=UPI0018CEAB94|nr:uncharacterized protein LOC119684547 [Teleopsis dalmanni]
MSGASAIMNFTPSDVDPERNMSVQVNTEPHGSHPKEQKYNYNFGFRKIGDKLIETKENSYQWHMPHNVELKLIFTAEPEHTLSHIDIKLDQTSTDHDAKIIGGGIGKNYIEVMVTARNTYWFKYEARAFQRTSLLHVFLDKTGK